MYSFIATFSNNQLTVRSIPEDVELMQWSQGDLNQGVILRPNYIVLDPIADGSFDAVVIVEVGEAFRPDPNAQRILRLPFIVRNLDEAVIATTSEEYYLNKLGQQIDIEDETRYGRYYLATDSPILVQGKYSLYYQICEGRPPVEDTDGEEIYFRFYFSKVEELKAGIALIGDDFGLTKNQIIAEK